MADDLFIQKEGERKSGGHFLHMSPLANTLSDLSAHDRPVS